MLGRLFNKSSAHLSDLAVPIAPPAATSRVDNFSDSYTRSLLYGTTDPLAAHTDLDAASFRIVVLQDASIRMKSALYDSALDAAGASGPNSSQLPQLPTNTAGSNTAAAPGTDSMTSGAKIDQARYHNLSELADYMFGCGFPVTELSLSTKLHSLPPLPKTPNAILITRLFSVNSKFTFSALPDTPMDPTSDPSDNSWSPHSTLPLPHTSKHSRDLTRFGIAIVVPVPLHELSSLVTNNWEELIAFLLLYQKLVITKLKMHSTVNPGSKRMHHVLQLDYELKLFLAKFVALFRSLYQTPRLLVGLKRSDTTLFNWCHHVGAWLEFKDGVNSGLTAKLNFLASLFAVLLPIRRHLVAHKPADKSHTVTRVVIMTGNPVVVQKLIFIISGILADDVLLSVESVKGGKLDRKEKFDTKETKLDTDSTNSALKSSNSTNSSPEIHSPSRKSTNSIDKIDLPSKPATKTPATASPTTPSLASSFSKGWEIPKKTPTMSTVATPVNFSPQKLSSSPTSSLQYLSSSLSSSYNSSSWKNMPFFDKWRSSVGSSGGMSSSSSYSAGLTGLAIATASNGAAPDHGNGQNNTHNSHSYSHNTHNSLSNPHNTLSNALSNTHSNTHRRIASYRTPSPAVEYDEFNWNSTVHPVSTATSNNALTGLGFSLPQSLASSSSTLKPLTRNQSTFDLSVLTSTTGNTKYNASQLANVERTPSTIQIRSKNGTSLSSCWQKECETIMAGDPVCSVVKSPLGDRVVQVEKVPDIVDEKMLSREQNLAPLAGYLDEFRPEFALQLCPIKLGLDQEIINTMKNDVVDHRYTKSGVGQTISRTILVSLLAREIKEFKITSGSNPWASLSSSSSPNGTGSVHGANDNISVERLFSPRSKNGSIEPRKISKIDNYLNRMIAVAKSVLQEECETESDAEKFDKVRELMREMVSECGE